MSRAFIHVLAFGLALQLFFGACASTPNPTSAPEQPTPTQMRVVPTQLPKPTSTPQPTPTLAPQIGTTDRPIKLLFVPSIEAERIVAGGQLLAETLNKATGLTFEVVVPNSYIVTLEEMCASPDDSIGFLTTLGYVLTEQLCGVKVAAKAVQSGYDWNVAMLIVPRDGAYQQLADINGKKWAYPDVTSISSYLYPLFMFKEAGITPGDSIAAGSHEEVIKTVYHGKADFGTAFFSPPRVDGNVVEWESWQDADVPAELLGLCLSAQDEEALRCGNFEIRDARRNVVNELPDVAQKVRILTTTPKIPNDTIAFSPDFHADLMQKILDALFVFAKNDPEGFAKAFETYSWSSISPAAYAEYDLVRLAVQASGFKIEALDQ